MDPLDLIYSWLSRSTPGIKCLRLDSLEKDYEMEISCWAILPELS